MSITLDKAKVTIGWSYRRCDTLGELHTIYDDLALGRITQEEHDVLKQYMDRDDTESWDYSKSEYNHRFLYFKAVSLDDEEIMSFVGELSYVTVRMDDGDPVTCNITIYGNNDKSRWE